MKIENVICNDNCELTECEGRTRKIQNKWCYKCLFEFNRQWDKTPEGSKILEECLDKWDEVFKIKSSRFPHKIHAIWAYHLLELLDKLKNFQGNINVYRIWDALGEPKIDYQPYSEEIEKILEEFKFKLYNDLYEKYVSKISIAL